jgi:cob(I)alamin adenosyltransferase
LHAGILTEEELLALLDRNPPGPEWVLTGRGAPDSVIERADLVTQMREIKHYFSSGVAARKGIEY